MGVRAGREMRRMTHWLGAVACAIAVVGQPPGALPAQAGSLSLTGAGSTFVAPFFDRALVAYTHGKPIRASYQAIGSGAGIWQFSGNKIDFVAADAPLDGMDLALVSRSGGPVVQVPIVLGAVVVAYNEPKLSGALRLDGATLAAMFMGTITTWNSPTIGRLNPHLRLPADRIGAVHRWDSSGTTATFTSYLSQSSRAWAQQIGTGKAVAWPGGFHGTDSAGVASWIRRHEGTIGYVQWQDALKNHLPYVMLKNRAGAFVLPTAASVGAAAAQFPKVSAANPAIVNAPGRRSYPLAAYSWVSLRRQPRMRELGLALAQLFRWLDTRGQIFARPLGYVPLPSATQRQAITALAGIGSL